MKVSQPELFGSVAIVLYIVLFAHSPPTALRRALSNVLIASVVFAGIAYITLWKSRTIGVLLTLAFLITMTRVTEHLTTQPDAPTTGGTPGQSDYWTTDEKGNKVDVNGKIMASDTTTLNNKGVVVNADGSAAPPAPVPKDAVNPADIPGAPATNTVHSGSSMCNVESFAPY
jgi:hypothetical protein